MWIKCEISISYGNFCRKTCIFNSIWHREASPSHPTMPNSSTVTWYQKCWRIYAESVPVFTQQLDFNSNSNAWVLLCKNTCVCVACWDSIYHSKFFYGQKFLSFPSSFKKKNLCLYGITWLNRSWVMQSDICYGPVCHLVMSQLWLEWMGNTRLWYLCSLCAISIYTEKVLFAWRRSCVGIANHQCEHWFDIVSL